MAKREDSEPRAKIVPRLGPLERRIMEIAWRDDEVAVRDVAAALRSEGESAYTTVMTVMSRLVQKGMLERQLRGRAYLYRPRTSRDAYQETFARDRVRDLIGEFGDVAIAQFAEELQDVDPERARRLGRLLRGSPQE